MNILADTAEFNEAAGKPKAKEPWQLQPEANAQHIKHLREEFRELLRALANEDRAAILDALVDLAYVAGGYIWAINYPRPWGIHLENASKQIYVWPCIGLIGACIERVECKVSYSLSELIFHCYETAITMKLPFASAWDAVHAANMAKRLPDGTFIRNEAGKILKPPGWIAPDIESIVKAHDAGQSA